MTMPPRLLQKLLRATPTTAPVPHRALLYVSGLQASEFLNGLLASSIPSFGTGPFLSVFLHAQGRVIHDIFVYPKRNAKGQDGYVIEYDSRESAAPPLLPSLKRYVLRSKVKVEDVSDEYEVWSVWGSEKETIWETPRMWNFSRSGVIEPVWPADEPWPWGKGELSLRDRRAVGLGERMLIRKGDRPSASSSHDTVPSDAYTLHRILHGVSEGSVDIPPMQAFPMESNLDVMGGLDFRKGCYVGQELTVRTYHTGLVRKRILPVEIRPWEGGEEDVPRSDVPLDIKAVVIDEQSVGRPRPRGSGKLLSTANGVGLALLRLEHVEGVERGRLRLLTDVDAGVDGQEKRQWALSHWWPDWWPKQSSEESSAHENQH